MQQLLFASYGLLISVDLGGFRWIDVDLDGLRWISATGIFDSEATVISWLNLPIRCQISMFFNSKTSKRRQFSKETGTVIVNGNLPPLSTAAFVYFRAVSPRFCVLPCSLRGVRATRCLRTIGGRPDRHAKMCENDSEPPR